MNNITPIRCRSIATQLYRFKIHHSLIAPEDPTKERMNTTHTHPPVTKPWTILQRVLYASKYTSKMLRPDPAGLAWPEAQCRQKQFMQRAPTDRPPFLTWQTIYNLRLLCRRNIQLNTEGKAKMTNWLLKA